MNEIKQHPTQHLGGEPIGGNHIPEAVSALERVKRQIARRMTRPAYPSQSGRLSDAWMHATAAIYALENIRGAV